MKKVDLENKIKKLKSENINLQNEVKSLKERFVNALQVKHNAHFSDQTIINMFSFLAYEPQEHVYMAFLDNHAKIYHTILISKGTLGETVLHQRDIMREACIHNARGFFLIHNHPSGSVEQSDPDYHNTKRINNLCTEFGIEFAGHYIIALKDEKVELEKIDI